MSTNARKASLTRNTRETQIALELVLDGSGQSSIETGVPFFNHMLELLSKHSLMDLQIKASGDLDVDFHHTVEDVGLALGTALNQALGDRKGIVRYGWAMLPMDEALSQVAVDLGGRPYLVYQVAMKKKKVRDFDVGIFKHFWHSFAEQARMNLHIAQLYGEDIHHAHESIFKGVARALYMACAFDPRVKGVPSSKGKL